MKPALSTPSTVSRRDFVTQLALAGMALPLVGKLAQAQPTAGSSPSPTTVSVADGPTVIHVFAKPLHQMTWTEIAKLVAACGFGGIDYAVRVPQAHVLPANVERDLPQAVDAAHAEGLKVEMITTEITSAREPYTEKLLKTAAKLGIKYYRCGNWDYDPKLGVSGTFEKMRPGLTELAALNASLGIHGAIQNHAGTRIGGPVWDLYELLREIDPNALGVQYDIRHATVEGGQAWPLGLKLLRPWIRCTDIKDFKWQQTPGKPGVVEDVPMGEGIVPFDAYFELVRELGMKGPMSMHFEYPPFERAPKPLSKDEQRAQFAPLMRKDLAVLRGLMTKHRIA